MTLLRSLPDQHVDLPGSITISLLGTFQLFIDNQHLSISPGSNRRLLRNELLEQLWPEQDPALAGQSLNSLVYQLHRRLRQKVAEISIITYDNGYYHLSAPENVSIDIDYFEDWQQRARQALRLGDVEQGLSYCEQALMLYRGDLCCDTNIASVQVILERERLRANFLDLLAYLADYYLHQNPTQALTYIHRLLNQDPCREDAHRQAMRCYMRLGARAQALRQYQFCNQILASEFGAKPEPATEALFEQIRLTPEALQKSY
jgi:DNA-binding SARP family transcriptional activator